MSGLGTTCLTFLPFNVLKVSGTIPSMAIGNGRLLPNKYGAEATVRAEAGVNDSKHCISPELSISKIPYINEVVKRQSQKADVLRKTESDIAYLEEAYERCRILVAEHDKAVELGSKLLPKAQRRAFLAIMAWALRIDDLVDTTEADHIRSRYVDEWEMKTEDIFNGHPRDIFDAALVDTISKYHIDIQPFQDMLKGMRIETVKRRYANFEELFHFCYYMAGTGALMFIPFVGISPESTMSSETIYEGLVHVFIGAQLTDIIQDVSQDAERGKVYLPQDELAAFSVSDDDIFSRNVTEEWKAFIKMQIERARSYYNNMEEFMVQLDKDNCGKISVFMTSLREILDEIEENDYDNLTK